MTIEPVVAVGKEGRRYPERPIVGVLAVVMRGDRALVVRRANPPMSGRWGFPGGVLELGETVAQGAMRELFEETGVTVEPGQLTGVYKNMRLGVVSLVFRCRPVSGAAQPTTEASEVAWLDRAQVTGRMAEAFAIRLLDAVDADEPRIRIHDGQHLLS